MQNFFSHARKGFTLMELLIVIAIIAILTVAFLPTLRGGQSKARDSARRALISNVLTALESMINKGPQGLNPAIPADGGAVGACLEAFGADPGKAIAEEMGRVPELYSQTIALCPKGGIWYNKMAGEESYLLAIQVENKESANVVGGTTVDQVKALDTYENAIAATATPPGENAIAPYFYLLTKK